MPAPPITVVRGFGRNGEKLSYYSSLSARRTRTCHRTVMSGLACSTNPDNIGLFIIVRWRSSRFVHGVSVVIWWSRIRTTGKTHKTVCSLLDRRRSGWSRNSSHSFSDNCVRSAVRRRAFACELMENSIRGPYPRGAGPGFSPEYLVCLNLAEYPEPEVWYLDMVLTRRYR